MTEKNFESSGFEILIKDSRSTTEIFTDWAEQNVYFVCIYTVHFCCIQSPSRIIGKSRIHMKQIT